MFLGQTLKMLLDWSKQNFKTIEKRNEKKKRGLGCQRAAASLLAQRPKPVQPSRTIPPSPSARATWRTCATTAPCRRPAGATKSASALASSSLRRAHSRLLSRSLTLALSLPAPPSPLGLSISASAVPLRRASHSLIPPSSSSTSTSPSSNEPPSAFSRPVRTSTALVVFSNERAALAHVASKLPCLSLPLFWHTAFALASPNSRSPLFALYWAERAGSMSSRAAAPPWPAMSSSWASSGELGGPSCSPRDVERFGMLGSPRESIGGELRLVGGLPLPAVTDGWDPVAHLSVARVAGDALHRVHLAKVGRYWIPI